MHSRRSVRGAFAATGRSEGFNDRLIETTRSQAQRHDEREPTQRSSQRADTLGDGKMQQTERFMEELRNVVSASVGFQKAQEAAADEEEVRKAKVCLDDADQFTPEFMAELQQIGEQQRRHLDRLEDMAPVPDLFGVLRRQCEACLDFCPGYRPQGVVCPSPSGELDFPTFCQNCGCPGCFHAIVKSKDSLPESLAASLRGYNIRQADLNFNGAMVALEILNDKKGNVNIATFVNLLKNEGIEILSMETRPLDIQEAMYLSIRQLQAKEKELDKYLNAGFDHDKIQKERQIHARGVNIFSAAIRCDYMKLDKTANDIEVALKRKVDKVLKLKNEKVRKRREGNETQGQEQEVEDASQRGGAAAAAHATRRTDQGRHDDELAEELARDVYLGPRGQSQTFQIRAQADINRMQTLGSTSSRPGQPSYAHTLGSQKDEQKLLVTLQRSPDVRKLLLNRYLIIVVSSTVHHNVDKKMRDDVLPDYFDVVGKDDVRLAHVSQRKIEAMEDSVLFAPYLYRLQKSIIVTEPADSLFGFEGRARIRGLQPGSGPPQLLAPPNRTMPAWPGTDLLGGGAMASARHGQTFVNPGKKQTGVTKFLTRRLKGVADDEAYMNADLPQKRERDAVKQFVMDAVKEEQQPKQVLTDTKWTKKDLEENRVFKNFGTMVDFFDYSGVRVQEAIRSRDLTRPVSFGKMLLPAGELQERYEKLAQQLAKEENKKVNLFAVAKVGTPNMIFPTTLDVQMRNFQDPHEYIQIADYFFPQTSKNQMTVVILRPLIVKNNLNDLFVEILKANDFLIVKRTIRTISREQAMKICQMEKVTKDNAELYIDTVLAGPSEILVMSKIGAIQDAKTICSGSLTGRRRSNQTGDSGQGPRNNVDSLSAMFEIAPFSSFNEFLDLEDFLVEHSRIFNYKKTAKGTVDMDRVDALNFQKAMEIRLLLNAFTRSAKLAAIAAQTEHDAHMMIDLFDPALGQLEELILVLNPLYNHLVPAAEELLVRMQYNFVNKQKIMLNSEQVKHLLQDKFPVGSRKTQRLVQIMERQDVYFYHLTKHVAMQELQALYELSEAVFEDHLMQHPKVVSERGAFLAEHIPYLFLLMDSNEMFEKASELLYEPAMMTFTGSDFVDKLSLNQKNQIIEICLFTTAGESTFVAMYDNKDNLVRDREALDEHIAHVKMSSLCRPPRNLAARFGQIENYTEEPSILPIHTFAAQNESSVQYIVESEEHTLYEVRFHKINHRGDVNPNSLQVEEQQLQDTIEFDDAPPTRKTVQIVTEEEREARELAQKEMAYFFERFCTLNFYYEEVNRKCGGGLVPSFYRFKMYPMGGETLNRVYEVEEHMGRVFIDELAEVHFRDSVFQREQNDKLKKLLGEKPKSMAQIRQNQHSLPSYVYGGQLAQLVKKLEKVRCKDEDTLKGAGPLIYDKQQQVIRGERDIKTFYKSNRRAYEAMLEQMKKRWDLYISKLETDLIESKLQLILGSVTFRYSRSPDYLSLIPDRLTEMNLRLKNTIKILSDDYKADAAVEKMNDQEREEKGFYKDVYKDPNRAKDLRRLLGSVLYAIARDAKSELQPERKLKQHLASTEYTTQLADTLLPSKSYVIHRHPAISGVTVAKKPRSQLIASLLFLIKFWLKKVDPKPQLFKPTGQDAHAGEAEQHDAEEEYNVFLQSLENGVIEGYGIDEIEKVVDVRALKQGHVSEFDAILDHKLERQQQYELEKNAWLQQKRRRMRNDPSITLQELIEKEIREPAAEAASKEVPYIEQYMKERRLGLQDDKQNKQFLDLLEKAGMKFGRNVLKLADDFCAKLEIEREKQREGKDSIQEKISLVRMEYFLYAFTEAHRLQLEIKKYQRMVNIFSDQVTTLEDEKSQINEKQQQARRARDGSSLIMDNAVRRFNEEMKRVEMEINTCQKRISDTRFKMSKRETELLLVFRELCGCEIHAPEDRFKGDRLVKQGKAAALLEDTSDDIVRPMANFWRPLRYEHEYLVKPNSEQAQRYQVEEEDSVRDEPGKYLADGLRERLRAAGTTRPAATDAKEAGRSPKDEQSHSAKFDHPQKRKVNKLREFQRPEFKEDIRFRALKNPAYAREKETMAHLRRDLLLKTTVPAPGLRPPERTTADLITPGHDTPTEPDRYVADPFSHLRNKEKGGQLVGMAIDQFFIDDGVAAQQSGLDQDQCRALAHRVYKQLKANNVNCEDYTEPNFETSFGIYKNRHTDQVDVGKLRNFVMCLTEL